MSTAVTSCPGTRASDDAGTLPMIFNVGEAKTHFSRLLALAETGVDVVIARNGEAVARLVPVVKRRREFGFRSTVTVPDSVWFEPMSEEELALWEDGPIFPSEPESVAVEESKASEQVGRDSTIVLAAS